MSDDLTNKAKAPAESDDAERELLARSADLMESKSETLDAATLSRLHSARSAALQQKRGPQWHWMPIGGAITAAVLVVAVLQVETDSSQSELVESLPQLVDSAPANVDDFELLASAADLELLEELEFYMWLESDQGVEA
ncbi:MAG: hypothetical protein AB8B48_20190 [Pseudomonadales bacterium]